MEVVDYMEVVDCMEVVDRFVRRQPLFLLLVNPLLDEAGLC